jgi:hypothetical protein
VHCIDHNAAPKRHLAARAGWVFLMGVAFAMPALAQTAPKAKPAAAPKTAAAPAVPRNLEEFKKVAARKMLAANPEVTYAGKPQQMNFGIPILEIELNDDATVKNISVVRPPANEAAADTVDIAMDAIRKAAPYGDISRLPKPVKWTEVFLFNDQKKFKPRSLE